MKNIKFNTIICKDCGSGYTAIIHPTEIVIIKA